MNLTSLCMGCMNDKGQAEVCPHCGFREMQASAGSNQFLPIRKILNEQYLIGQVLGNGGFGITYLAWDVLLQSKIAIKEYFPFDLVNRTNGKTEVSVYGGAKKANFEHGMQAFLEEARKLVKFDNPGIVSVRTYFESNGTAYFVMPFIEGLTLKDYIALKGEKIPLEQALSIIYPIMVALEEVHQTGVLHRDISPDNIYITNNGQVKLLDFGAARYAIGDLSKSLSIILKHGFAPFEQYQSKGVQGPWTDIYAIAATVYRIVSGKIPVEALERLDEDGLEPLSKLGIGISPQTESVLLKALSVRPKDRYQDIREFKDALKDSIEIPEFKLEKQIAVNCPGCGGENVVPLNMVRMLHTVDCTSCSISLRPSTVGEPIIEAQDTLPGTDIIGQDRSVSPGTQGGIPESSGSRQNVGTEILSYNNNQDGLNEKGKVKTKKSLRKKIFAIAAVILACVIPIALYQYFSVMQINKAISAEKVANLSTSTSPKTETSNNDSNRLSAANTKATKDPDVEVQTDILKKSEFMTDNVQPQTENANDLTIDPFNPNISMAGKQYAKGIRFATNGSNALKFYLNNKYKRVTGLIGIDDSDRLLTDTRPMAIVVLGDGKKITSFSFRPTDFGQVLDIDVTGVKILEISSDQASSHYKLALANLKLNSDVTYESLSDTKLSNLSGKKMSEELKPYSFYTIDSHGQYFRDLNYKINPRMSMDGTEFDNGYQVKTESRGYTRVLLFNIGGKVKKIHGLVGRDESSKNGLDDTTQIRIWAGNDKNGIMADGGRDISKLSIPPGFTPQSLDLNVEGVELLAIYVTNLKDDQNIDFADIVME